MASLREQILAAMATALTGTTPAGASVYRSRETAISRAVVPAIVVLPSGERVQRAGQQTDRHELTAKVVLYVRGDPWDQIADPVAVAMHKALISSAALAALSIDIRLIDAEFEAEEADRTAGTLTHSYHITYFTRAGDISAAP